MNPEKITKQSHVTAQPHTAFLRTPLLPLEILLELFLLSEPAIDQAQAPHKTTLALVCRFWNSIIDSTPILWSRISIADEISYVRRSLLKSDKSPIDIYGAAPGLNASGIRERCSWFLREVTPHTGRWRHVTLQVVDDVERGTFDTISPLLQSVKLCSKYHVRVSDGYLSLLDNAGRHAAHLREVSLDNAYLPRWDISFPPSLSTLELKSVFSSGPSVSELLSILAACPKLAVLRLRYLSSPGVDHNTNDPTNAAPIVELGALEELSLKDVSATLVRHLLVQLRFPDECAVSIACSISSSNPTTSFLNPALSRYRGTFQRPGESPKITIFVVRAWLQLIVTRGRWYINLYLGRTRGIRDALNWFRIFTESSNPGMYLESSFAEGVTCNDVPIVLKFSNGTRTQVEFDYLEPVLDLQCITKIDMGRLRSQTQTKVLCYLSKPRAPTLQTTMTTGAELSGADGPQVHRVDGRPFPGLRELVLKGLKDDPLKAATSFIKSRSDRRGEGGALEGRARLERIEFVGKDDETIQHGEYPLALDPNEPRWNLHLELFEALSEDAKVFWGGKRISKTGVMN